MTFAIGERVLLRFPGIPESHGIVLRMRDLPPIVADLGGSLTAPVEVTFQLEDGSLLVRRMVL